MNRSSVCALVLALAAGCAGPSGGIAHGGARALGVSWRYLQGVARTGAGWVYSSNDALFMTDERGRRTHTRSPAIPAEWRARGYDHIGDIDVVGDVLYAPLEQPHYREGRQAVLLFSASTLEFREGFELAQHENSFVSVDPGAQIAYSLDRFGGDALLRYDVLAGWKALEPLHLSRALQRVQGGDVSAGAIWLSTDDPIKGVYRVDLATGRVDELASMAHGLCEVQGIDATRRSSGFIRVLVIDFLPFPGVRTIDLDVDPAAGFETSADSRTRPYPARTRLDVLWIRRLSAMIARALD